MELDKNFSFFLLNQFTEANLKMRLKLKAHACGLMAIVVAITAMMLALVMLLGFAGATQILAQLRLPPRTNTSNSSNSRLNAEAIYESNSVTIDSDVEDLVIMIPDSSGDNGRHARDSFLAAQQ
jgi:hypothetical protein